QVLAHPPPPVHRKDGEMVLFGQLCCSAAPRIGVNRAAMAEVEPKRPLVRVGAATCLPLFFPRLAVDSRAEFTFAFQRPSDIKSQPARCVTVAVVRLAWAGIRLHKI